MAGGAAQFESRVTAGQWALGPHSHWVVVNTKRSGRSTALHQFLVTTPRSACASQTTSIDQTGILSIICSGREGRATLHDIANSVGRDLRGTAPCVPVNRGIEHLCARCIGGGGVHESSNIHASPTATTLIGVWSAIQGRIMGLSERASANVLGASVLERAINSWSSVDRQCAINCVLVGRADCGGSWPQKTMTGTGAGPQ